MYEETAEKRIYAGIDLDALLFNVHSMKKNLRPGTLMIAVVKTDAYGHGAVAVSKAVEEEVWGFAVATAAEAYELQDYGIRKPVLLLGPVHESLYPELIRRKIRIPVFTEDQAEALSRAALSSGENAVVHLVLDTGMNRIGMKPDDEGLKLALKISSLDGIEIEGIFTHLARADESDKGNAEAQIALFRSFNERLKDNGLDIPLKHVSNSAAIIDMPDEAFNVVRAGISLYGMYASDEIANKEKVPLRPVMSLKSYITYIKTIEPGDAVSYGGTFVADRTMRVATVCAGYGDGYPRNLSGKGRVLIRGKSAPILGRVCMDQFMVDVTDIPDAEEWDTVTLIGKDGDDEITVEEIAGLSGRFHYEVVCDINKRVPRIYVKEKENGTRQSYIKE